MQYWDDILYPHFLSAIRGSYYGIVNKNFIDEECYNLALRAISAFKFPRISTAFTTYWAVRDEDGELVAVEQTDEGAIPHAYFKNDLTYREIDIILAWMKYYWAEEQVSNADNFEDMYTDANIKTFSRANAVSQNIKLMADFRSYARELENSYGRTSDDYKPTIGDINV